MVALRTRIARWLDPETARNAQRWHRLRAVYLDEVRTWLAVDFPVVDEAIYFALVRDRNFWRDREQQDVSPVPGKPWIHGIHDFREHLRAKYPSPSTKAETHE